MLNKVLCQRLMLKLLLFHANNFSIIPLQESGSHLRAMKGKKSNLEKKNESALLIMPIRKPAGLVTKLKLCKMGIGLEYTLYPHPAPFG